MPCAGAFACTRRRSWNARHATHASAATSMNATNPYCRTKSFTWSMVPSERNPLFLREDERGREAGAAGRPRVLERDPVGHTDGDLRLLAERLVEVDDDGREV